MMKTAMMMVLFGLLYGVTAWASSNGGGDDYQSAKQGHFPSIGKTLAFVGESFARQDGSFLDHASQQAFLMEGRAEYLKRLITRAEGMKVSYNYLVLESHQYYLVMPKGEDAPPRNQKESQKLMLVFQQGAERRWHLVDGNFIKNDKMEKIPIGMEFGALQHAHYFSEFSTKATNPAEIATGILPGSRLDKQFFEEHTLVQLDQSEIVAKNIVVSDAHEHVCDIIYLVLADSPLGSTQQSLANDSRITRKSGWLIADAGPMDKLLSPKDIFGRWKAGLMKDGDFQLNENPGTTPSYFQSTFANRRVLDGLGSSLPNDKGAGHRDDTSIKVTGAPAWLQNKIDSPPYPVPAKPQTVRKKARLKSE